MPNTFRDEVIRGLSAKQKSLPSKYFYDAKGDKIFQQIMDCEEYYLTDCDMEIFENQSKDIADSVRDYSDFEVVELGAGDAVKSTHLLREFANNNVDFKYIPIDISENIIELLSNEMSKRIPGIKVKGLAGEYLEMLDKAYQQSEKPKLLMFLGSSIGNFELDEGAAFLKKLYDKMKSGDRLLIGFDLKKDPNIILAAYNDSKGFTKAFNENLLHRINSELNADFDTNNFQHFPIYNPMTGACRSFLISQKKQAVKVSDVIIEFEAFEAIDMELSQKFTKKQISELASNIGFKTENMFCDTKNWYCNILWRKP